jgi:mannose-6-phosphate isomerase-like protein (cupin superfamily)
MNLKNAFVMQQGDIYVVKKATNHRVFSKRECLIMLIEPKTTETYRQNKAHVSFPKIRPSQSHSTKM